MEPPPGPGAGPERARAGKHIVTAPGDCPGEARIIAATAGRHPGQLCILAMEMRFLDTVHALRSLLHQGVRPGPRRRENNVRTRRYMVLYLHTKEVGHDGRRALLPRTRIF